VRLRPLAFATFLVWCLRIGACGVGACGFGRLWQLPDFFEIAFRCTCVRLCWSKRYPSSGQLLFGGNTLTRFIAANRILKPTEPRSGNGDVIEVHSHVKQPCLGDFLHKMFTLRISHWFRISAIGRNNSIYTNLNLLGKLAKNYIFLMQHSYWLLMKKK